MTPQFGNAEALPTRDDIREAIAYFVALAIHAGGAPGPALEGSAVAGLGRCGLFAGSTEDERRALLRRMAHRMEEDAEGHAQHYALVLEADRWNRTAAAVMAEVMLCDGVMGFDDLHAVSRLARQIGVLDCELDAMVRSFEALRRPWGD